MFYYISTSNFRHAVRASPTLILAAVLSCVTIGFCVIESNFLKSAQVALRAKSYELERSLKILSFSGVIGSSAPVVLPLGSLKILSAVADDMQSLAQQSGLNVLDVNCRPIDSVVGSNLSRIEISAKFRGTYVSMRKFIGSMLSTYDSLALESVIVHRDRPTDLMLDIELHWTLFYRKQR